MLRLVRLNHWPQSSRCGIVAHMQYRLKSSGVQIYEGKMTKSVRAVKTFSLGSSVVGLLFQPIFVNKMLSYGSVPVIITASSILGFFTFAVPVLLHLVTRRYVVSMDYNDETSEYTATTISFFLRPKTIKFKVDDVRVPEIDSMFTSFFVHRKPIFVEMLSFKKSNHYVHLMGYDKPIDISLDVTNSLNKKL